MVKKLFAARFLILLSCGVVPAAAQPDGFRFHSEEAERWFKAGEYFAWTSTTVNNNGRTVNVHYRTFGDRANPALVLLHGYPTSSFDFREMIGFLDEEYFIATLDFPGFGFSDKPQDGYSYMLEDDAKLVDYFVREIVELDEFSLFTHDRGVSVGLAFLGNYLDATDRAYDINYHFLSPGAGACGPGAPACPASGRRSRASTKTCMWLLPVSTGWELSLPPTRPTRPRVLHTPRPCRRVRRSRARRGISLSAGARC